MRFSFNGRTVIFPDGKWRFDSDQTAPLFRKGMVQIGRRVNWHKIHAEYVAGGISQRSLARKYNIPWSTLEKRAAREKWAADREKARTIVEELAVQETADAVAENAATAARIKAKLLQKLEKEIDALPDLIGSETRQTMLENEYLKNEKGKPIGTKPSRSREIMKAYSLRQLTSAYKDLTDDMNLNTDSEPVRIIF